MSLQQHPTFHAERSPQHPAVINATTGAVITYGQMNSASINLANHFYSSGLRAGDHIALLIKNHEGFFIAMWAALRAGLIVTPISTQLTHNEVLYIARDCDAKAVLLDSAIAETAHELAAEIKKLGKCWLVNQHLDRLSGNAVSPIYPEEEGSLMLYSSGTTGYPKGIVAPWQRCALGEAMTIALMQEAMFGLGQNSRFFTAAPLYHAAPLHWSLGAHRLGATVVIAEKFDAEGCLQTIEQQAVTHSLWVPTMFVRLLNLSDNIRQAYSLKSLQFAAHLAAPCPISVKERMISWWGSIIHEFYSGSEGNGQCYISPEDWIKHKGSVGKPMFGSVEIYDEKNQVLPAETIGMVGFSGGREFSYHKDEMKTRDSLLADKITTLGDIGYLDNDGFLYLTGRKGQTIISGGVNIYPKEVENLIMQHDAVEDCHVFPLPDEEYGDVVAAAVLLKNEKTALSPNELILWCKANGASFKAPKKVFYCDEIPRMATGKVRKVDQDKLIQSFA